MAILTDPHSDSAYAVAWPQGYYGGMILHSGPSKDDAPLATVKPSGRIGQDFSISLPTMHPGEPPRTEILRHVVTLRRETFWFAFPVENGPSRWVEKFEWRHSHGNEVKNVEGGSGWGWKLVRVGRDDARPGGLTAEDDDEGGGDRADGLASDGKEIVAVWADPGSLSLSKMGTFEFRGSGATGELGKLWSVMAILSCMCIWQDRMRQTTTIGVAAGAS